jgi:hypothetical protein
MKTHISIIVSALLLLSRLADAQGNLVVNGGFDTDASGWAATNVSGSGYLISGGNPGGFFALVGPSASIPTISQEISGLTPGQLYVVSGDYKSGGKNFAANSFGVALDGNFLFLANSPADYNWYSFSFDYTASSTSALLSLSSQLNGTGYSYAVDTISMHSVPEPSVSCLFGLCVLFFVWRVARPNKSPEPTAVGAISSAVAVHAASRRWLSFFR